MVEEAVVIKKYSNRRLYDTGRSRYVNLEEIADLVRQGRTVQVLDARSGEDLTRQVLTQIIMEHEREGESVFPLSFLHSIIRYRDQGLTDFLQRYLSMSVEVYVKAQREMEDRLRSLADAGWLKALNPMEALLKMVTPTSSDEVLKRETELQELRQRLEELERKMARSDDAQQ